jgi:hypothetical protein
LSVCETGDGTLAEATGDHTIDISAQLHDTATDHYGTEAPEDLADRSESGIEGKLNIGTDGAATGGFAAIDEEKLNAELKGSANNGTPGEDYGKGALGVTAESEHGGDH